MHCAANRDTPPCLQLAVSEKRFHEVADGGHNDTPIKGGARYIDNWREFVRAVSNAREDVFAAGARYRE